jgi:hypothetical protein
MDFGYIVLRVHQHNMHPNILISYELFGKCMCTHPVGPQGPLAPMMEVVPLQLGPFTLKKAILLVLVANSFNSPVSNMSHVGSWGWGKDMDPSCQLYCWHLSFPPFLTMLASSHLPVCQLLLSAWLLNGWSEYHKAL